MNVEMRSLTFRQSFFWVFVYFSKLIANAFQLGGKSNEFKVWFGENIKYILYEYQILNFSVIIFINLLWISLIIIIDYKFIYKCIILI